MLGKLEYQDTPFTGGATPLFYPLKDIVKGMSKEYRRIIQPHFNGPMRDWNHTVVRQITHRIWGAVYTVKMDNPPQGLEPWVNYVSVKRQEGTEQEQANLITNLQGAYLGSPPESMEKVIERYPTITVDRNIREYIWLLRVINGTYEEGKGHQIHWLGVAPRGNGAYPIEYFLHAHGINPQYMVTAEDCIHTGHYIRT